MRRAIPLLTLLAGVTWPLGAQEPERPSPVGVISGRITSELGGGPVAGAAVRLVGTERVVASGDDGRFLMAGVPVGVHSLEIRALGFAPLLIADVVVGSGKPFVVDVALDVQPVALAPIAIRPSYFRRADQASTSSQTLRGEETRRAPGTLEDVVRAVALLPGVGLTPDSRNDLLVRGGAPFENLFLIDGIQVPNINHFGSQGSTGGPLSLVNTDFLRDVTFSSGGFGPRYGDRTSSVTDIALRDGNEERLSGEINLSATGFGVIAEGPLGAGSFLASIQRSYLDLIFKAAGQPFIPEYWDFTLKTTQRVGSTDRLSFLTIGALDDVTFTNETADDRFDNRRILAPELRQYVSGVTWTHQMGDGSLSATLGRTYVRFESVQRDSLVPPVELFRNVSTEGETSLRLDLALPLGDRVGLEAGLITSYADELSYRIEIDGDSRLDGDGRPVPLSLDTAFTAFRASAYVDAEVALTPALRARAGARLDRYGVVDAWRAAPRLGLSLDVDELTTANLSLGRYYQAPSSIWLVGDRANPERLTPFYADQAVVGLQRLLRPDLKLQVEGFYKRYRDYPARVWRPQAVLAPAGFEDVTLDIPFGLEPLVSRGRGKAYGAELFLQKRLSRVPLFGLASLSLARSEFDGLDGVARPGSYDTRVIGTALLGWRINPGWEVSGKFRIATGRPTTPFVASGPDAGRLDFTRYNANRLPTFHALDLRVDRRWSFRGWQLELYVDVQNVYARENVTELYWDARLGAATSESGITVLPTLGLNFEF